MMSTDTTLQVTNYLAMRALLGIATFIAFIALIAIFACEEKRHKIIAGIICFLCFGISLGLQAYDYSITHQPENIERVN